MNLQELLALRDALIAAGRSLEVDKIERDTHFYVLDFNSDLRAPRLRRSGTFLETVASATTLGRRRGNLGARLCMIRWDGDEGTDPSRHTLDSVGLVHLGDRPTLLAVESLAGIEPAPIDQRHLKQRKAHTARTTE